MPGEKLLGEYGGIVGQELLERVADEFAPLLRLRPDEDCLRQHTRLGTSVKGFLGNHQPYTPHKARESSQMRWKMQGSTR